MSEFGLLGRKLGHSFSPRIHSLLADYAYGLYEVEPSGLDSFLSFTRLQGMNVTIPYKKSVIRSCATLSPQAEKIGSVNTLVREDYGWHGDNTDYFGFRYMVESSGVPVAGKKAIIFGNGGASLTVRCVLADLGAAQVVVISRSGENNYENLHRHFDAQILVNATPVGMYPNNGEAVCSLEGFSRCEAVFDLIYNPARTALMLDAESRGIPAWGGLLMLVAQAHRAAELFTNKAIPGEKIAQITSLLERETCNIVLIGMPGCGKSAKGRLLAERMGRAFVDADEYFAEKYGLSPAQTILAEGEAAFRAMESSVLAELGAKSGLVVATGGGCVTVEENYRHLHQNGLIIWLQRPVEDLPTRGRPLSQTSSPQQLWSERAAMYDRFADLSIAVHSGVPAAVDAIMEAIK